MRYSQTYQDTVHGVLHCSWKRKFWDYLASGSKQIRNRFPNSLPEEAFIFKAYKSVINNSCLLYKPLMTTYSQNLTPHVLKHKSQYCTQYIMIELQKCHMTSQIFPYTIHFWLNSPRICLFINVYMYNKSI